MRVAGVEQVAQVFCLRLCYSLKSFVLRLPDGAPGVLPRRPRGRLRRRWAASRERVTYDNLSSAVRKLLQGRNRVEQEQFVGFRGHYLFASHFCLPGQAGAHEKPLAESLVGYARRNFFVPVPEVASWEALNRLLAGALRRRGRPDGVGP